MKYKKYNFIKILEEYNKKYNKKHKLDSRILSATITHCPEKGSFNVIYIYDNDTSHKYSLGDFIYYKVIPSLDVSLFIAIILHKEEQDLSIKIEIWPPSKIRYAYLSTNHFSGGGDLGKSCMRHKTSQGSLSFYIKNNAKIVVAVDDNNKIHARALLWEDVKSTKLKKPFTYLDRVYARSSSFLSLFYDLAKENGWKRYDGTSPGNAGSGLYKDNLDIIGMCHMPWVDTFKCLYYKDGCATSSGLTGITHHIKHPDYRVTLNHVEGAIGGVYIPALDPNKVREAITNNHISKKDAVFVKRYNAYVLKKNIANVKGAYYSIHDNKVVKSQLDGFILKINSMTEVFTNELISKAEAVHSTKYNGYMHKSNIIDIKGEMYHKKDTDITCFDNKWYHISQCFINYDRKGVNEEFAKQIRSTFSYKDFSEIWIPNTTITRRGDLIPKESAIIAYDLVCIGMSREKCANSFAISNPKFNKAKFLESCDKDVILYQEVYCTDKKGLIQLNTGEFIVGSANNKKYLKKFNNKYYIKQDFKLPSKHQLTLF